MFFDRIRCRVQTNTLDELIALIDRQSGDGSKLTEKLRVHLAKPPQSDKKRRHSVDMAPTGKPAAIAMGQINTADATA